MSDVAREAAPLLLELVREHEAKNADLSRVGSASRETGGAVPATSGDAA